jgi:hypothetical protein
MVPLTTNRLGIFKSISAHMYTQLDSNVIKPPGTLGGASCLTGNFELSGDCVGASPLRITFEPGSSTALT